MAQRRRALPAVGGFEHVPQQRPVAAEAIDEPLDVAGIERPGAARDHVADRGLVGKREHVVHDQVTA
jgi:hypothetical protein